MKNFDFNNYGVQEMNTFEMQETDGGFVLIICAICAVALLLSSSCQTQITIQVGGANNDINSTKQSADSTFNGNNLQVPIK